jgi:hypothetical protein
MEYLPARCDACGFVVLVPHSSSAARLRACPKCDSEISIFAGAKQYEDERTVFEAMSAAIHASVRPITAALLLEEIEELTLNAPATAVEVIAARVPAIREALCLPYPASTPSRRLAILMTILRARSSIRWRSGFVPASTTGNLASGGRTSPIKRSAS